MKLSYEWLKEYIDIKVKPEKLANILTMSGSEVEAVLDVSGDKIMELEITSNRPDCLSIIGLAREVSAVLNKELCLPDINVPKIQKKAQKVECVIENKALCPRYTARVITGVKIKDVNLKIRKKIESLGLRPVNNVVDITNFCLIEMGQPLHAFDLDRIKGRKVIVREAKEGEKIITIDDVERFLKKGMLVIADEKDPIAIAGIMGSKSTEVTGHTRNILLESAYFAPLSVRKTARALSLSSDSSYRFERGVDRGMVVGASHRAAKLISAETGGGICEFYDKGNMPIKKTVIDFDIKNAERILGTSFSKKEIKGIFKHLGVEAIREKNTKLFLKVPSFREDLKSEIDLVEEAARIYGYDKIAESVSRFESQIKRKSHERTVIEKLRESLVASGLNEIMTYSLISEEAFKRFSALSGEIVMLKNPISEEQKVLTPQLLDGMFRTISRNINRKNNNLAFFEIGTLYSRSGDDFDEIPALCIALTGLTRENWAEGKREATFYDLKGIIETVFRRLKISLVFCPSEIENFDNSAEIELEGKNKKIGFLGSGAARTLSEYDIPQDLYVAQIRLDEVTRLAELTGRYAAIDRFPSSSRDISILCEETLSAETILKLILETEGKIIRSAKLVDVYEGKQISSGKKSLSYSIEYGAQGRTLTDKEVDEAHSRIKDALIKKLGVAFR